MAETFCLKCGCHQPYRTKTHFVDDVVRGVRFRWVEDTAFCSVCGDEVYVPEVNDRNCANREFNYQRYAKAGGKTCGSCDKFLGGGDWSLCCKIKHDLTYEDSPACEEHGFRKGKKND